MTAADLPLPSCPTCGGQMHDNRKTKTSAQAPDFRCKNPDCLDGKGQRSALWARDLIRKAEKSPPAPAAAAPAASAPGDFTDLARLHTQCMRHVVQYELPLLQNVAGDVAGAVSALTAQLFIEAARRGLTSKATPTQGGSRR